MEELCHQALQSTQRCLLWCLTGKDNHIQAGSIKKPLSKNAHLFISRRGGAQSGEDMRPFLCIIVESFPHAVLKTNPLHQRSGRSSQFRSRTFGFYRGAPVPGGSEFLKWAATCWDETQLRANIRLGKMGVLSCEMAQRPGKYLTTATPWHEFTGIRGIRANTVDSFNDWSQADRTVRMIRIPCV